MSDLSGRYALFSGSFYYPAGGWSDLNGVYATLDEAKAAHEIREYSWAHVVDLDARQIVASQTGQRPWGDGGA